MVTPGESLPPQVEQNTIENLLLLVDARVGNNIPLSDGQRYGAFSARGVSGQRYWLGLHQIPPQSSRFGEIAMIHTVPLRHGAADSNLDKHYYIFSDEGGLRIQEFNPLVAEDAFDDFESGDTTNSDDQIRAMVKHLQGKQALAMSEEGAAGLGTVYESDAQALIRLIAKAKPYNVLGSPILRFLLRR